MRAAVVTHEHELFQRIELLPAKIRSDHAMETYRTVIDGAKFLMLQSHDQAQEEGDWAKHFPEAIQRTCSYSPKKKAVITDAGSDGLHANVKQPISIKMDAPAACEVPPVPVAGSGKLPPAKPPKPSKLAAAEQALVPVPAIPSVPVESVCGGYNLWMPCSICGLEVTWPYMMHSEASRAMVTHNCSACGQVVCALCAPAGDQLPGDGLSMKHTLPDLKLALPALGLFTPTRVCLHCYSDSTYPGLSIDYLDSL